MYTPKRERNLFQPIFRINIHKRWRCLLLLVLFLVTGCGTRLANYMPWWEHRDDRAFQAHLEEGRQLFFEGDYSAAEAFYSELQKTDDVDVVRQALYGLACSRFMLADSRQGYLDAVETFEAWQAVSSPTSPDGEDPRMMMTLLSEVLSEAAPGKADALPGSGESALIRLFSARERIGDLEDQVSRLEEKAMAYEKQTHSMEDLKADHDALADALASKEKTLAAVMAELSKLKAQIQTLETIDQEIQEKKEGISSP